MKRLVFLLCISILYASSASADSHEGLIDRYHLNSDFSGRGVCVQMNPDLSGTGWACLWQDNSLYTEITDLLLDGFADRKYCSISWGGTDSNGHYLISLAECYGVTPLP
uniref:Uncharacterized protein n=1 Tax=Candidatus Kentrum sp. FM TaxID=2126340 RepID=A0A450T0K7_9GAMM|nr:MAG: hypothetical protein BECKFM1743C_GA0114222_102631 [Candidatus Kentron sp. FM]VFJ60058.1 MAG: hypothetical protein BECKFM1743A_GA0114220_102546 [Candidatus Kentron sp. FM]VFK13197.1 MAG: hypothetical protein BECKFM1743B_GA0114221_102691 [Candidatus Kentron sp. FM]